MNLGVVDESVGDRCGHIGAVKYFPPIGKGQIRCDNGGFALVPLADDLEE